MEADRDGLLDAIAARVIERLTSGAPLPLPGGPGPGPTGPSGEQPALPFRPPREPLPDLFPRTRLAVQGMELTQATQHYGTGFGATNGVPLVALKPLVARVYAFVQPGLLGDTISGRNVTGELVISRGGREVFRTGPTRSGGSRVGAGRSLDRSLFDQETSLYVATGGPIPALARVELNPPLNFRVPAWYLRPGSTTFTATVWLLGEASGGPTVSVSEVQWVHDAPVPRIALVRVKWKNAAGTVNTPSDADMLATTRLAERMLPFPYFDTTILGVDYERSGDFASPAASGGCNTRWNDLLDDLEETRVWTRLFELADIVYGLLPIAAVTPGLTTINSGCGRGGTAVGGSFCGAGYAQTFAHEIGHIYRRPHVAVAGDTSSDAAYPNYGGDPRSIGEVGIDAGAASVALHDPASVDDVMSYGNANWISPYTYRKIFDDRALHRTAPADPSRVRPLLVATFLIRRLANGGREVEISKAHRVEVAGSYRKLERGTPFAWVDLVDRRQRVIAAHPLYRSVSHATGCCEADLSHDEDAAELRFVEAIEWPSETSNVQVRRGDEVLAVFDVGEPPRLELEGPNVTPDGLELTVRAAHPRVQPSVVLLFTGDDGRSWVPVAFDPPERLVIDPRSLPGGEACRFRAVATAEFRSATDESDRFELPRRPRGLFVSADSDQCERGQVRLQAFVDTRGLGMPRPDEIAWRSEREGLLGFGPDLAVTLGDGRHEIKATVPDGIGGTLTETAIIVVGG